MSVIYKTKIEPVGDFDLPFSVKIPRGARPLSLQLQDGQPTVWWLCDEREPVEARSLRIIGTGWKFNIYEVGAYIGTWMQSGYVWHLFESTR